MEEQQRKNDVEWNERKQLLDQQRIELREREIHINALERSVEARKQELEISLRMAEPTLLRVEQETRANEDMQRQLRCLQSDLQAQANSLLRAEEELMARERSLGSAQREVRQMLRTHQTCLQELQLLEKTVTEKLSLLDNMRFDVYESVMAAYQVLGQVVDSLSRSMRLEDTTITMGMLVELQQISKQALVKLEWSLSAIAACRVEDNSLDSPRSTAKPFISRKEWESVWNKRSQIAKDLDTLAAQRPIVLPSHTIQEPKSAMTEETKWLISLDSTLPPPPTSSVSAVIEEVQTSASALLSMTMKYNAICP